MFIKKKKDCTNTEYLLKEKSEVFSNGKKQTIKKKKKPSLKLSLSLLSKFHKGAETPNGLELQS